MLDPLNSTTAPTWAPGSKQMALVNPGMPPACPIQNGVVTAGATPGNTPRLGPPLIGQVTGLVHSAQGRGAEHRCGGARLPVGAELEANPSGQVFSARPQAAFGPDRRHGRCRVQVVRQGVPLVSRRASGGHLGGQRRKACRGHAERIQDGFAYVSRVRGSAHPSDDLAEPLVGQVRVFMLCVRRELHGDSGGLPERLAWVTLIRGDGPVRARRFRRQPRFMREHPPDRHCLGRAERIGNRPQLRQPSDSRVVQIQPAGIAQLHDRRSGERLGDRRYAVEHCRVSGRSSGNVGEPGTCQPGELIAADNASHAAGQPVLLDERDKPGLQIRRAIRLILHREHVAMMAEHRPDTPFLNSPGAPPGTG